MNSDATVFSQRYQIFFEKSMTIMQTESVLREFVVSIGRALACNEIILGHVKILARLPEPALDNFIFLSLTRLDQVDQTPSEYWANIGGVTLDCLVLHVNVLVFGHTLSQVEEQVVVALKKLGGLIEQDNPMRFD